MRGLYSHPTLQVMREGALWTPRMYSSYAYEPDLAGHINASGKGSQATAYLEEVCEQGEWFSDWYL